MASPIALGFLFYHVNALSFLKHKFGEYKTSSSTWMFFLAHGTITAYVTKVIIGESWKSCLSTRPEVMTC